MFAQRERFPVKSFPRTARAMRMPQCTTKYTPNCFLRNRFGIIISTKVHRLAVVRHRLKRRFAAELRRLPNHHLDILCILSPRAVALDSAGIRRLIEDIGARLPSTTDPDIRKSPTP
jgi:ribonuclease P protein component